MCGITGFLHFDHDHLVSRDVIVSMANTLKHRGPDGEGYFVKNNLALGHRRLSIIDLLTGDQPMEDFTKNIVVAFNGEIYNYIELRSELESLGHKFRTNSDTEVIIKSYEEWDVECQNRFNGMWAFALWDGNKNKLFLSRDRIGKKPLYYAVDNETFVFGSEIKCIFAYGIPKVINNELFEIYLMLGYIPAPHTFFKGIKKLKAGQYIIVNNGSISVHQYWDLPEIDESDMISNRRYVYDNFLNLLNDSVRLRMRSDVRYGSFLSGGLDSASIVALMSRNSSYPVETFTIGFDDKTYDERDLARVVAKKFNTKHNEYIVEPDSFQESLEKICFSFDEPFGDSSAIPTGYVSKYARLSVKMVLTGDGGDEVLSGYTSYQREKFLCSYQSFPQFYRNLFSKVSNGLPRILFGKLKQVAQRFDRVLKSSVLNFSDRLVLMNSWYDYQLVKLLLDGVKHNLTIEDYFSDFFTHCTYRDNFYKYMYYDLKLSLPERMLVKVDRMSMLYSLETRAPFLDYRLVEFMVRVDKNIKMEGLQRKSILRKTIGNELPNILLKAPKKGFNVPLQNWFQHQHIKNEIVNICKDFDDLFNKEAINKLLNDTLYRNGQYHNLIWHLFVLNRVMKY